MRRRGAPGGSLAARRDGRGRCPARPRAPRTRWRYLSPRMRSSVFRFRCWRCGSTLLHTQEEFTLESTSRIGNETLWMSLLEMCSDRLSPTESRRQPTRQHQHRNSEPSLVRCKIQASLTKTPGPQRFFPHRSVKFDVVLQRRQC